MTHAYPDFGFQDPLHFELQEESENPTCFETNPEFLSIWKYLYNFVSGKGRFERFNNIIHQLMYEKNDEMLQKIIKDRSKAANFKLKL